MDIQSVLTNVTKLLVVLALICTFITFVTEFTKEIKCLKKIPTKLQVLITSIVVCTALFFAYLSYESIAFVWYYTLAIIFVSFVVAVICSEGWEYAINIFKRFYRKKEDFYNAEK